MACSMRDKIKAGMRNAYGGQCPLTWTKAMKHHAICIKNAKVNKQKIARLPFMFCTVISYRGIVGREGNTWTSKGQGGSQAHGC